MTKEYKRLRFGLVAMLVPLVFSQILVACSDDYDEQLPMSKDVTVHLGVSADDVIDVSLSRSYAYDYYADEGEFIHSLCVFIVKEDGTIVKKFSTDDDTSDTSIFTEDEQKLADVGNLTNWDSDLEDLEEGTYTIYAFANWETTFGEITYFGPNKIWTPYDEEELKEDPWYKLISKSEKESISEEEMTFALSDVCGKIDFTAETARYIPMSGKNTVTITEGNNNVNVKLDRLVAKVYVTLQVIDTSNVYTGYELTCSPFCNIADFAEKVWLFPSDEVIPEDDYYESYSYLNLVDDLKVEINGEAVYIGYTYINESDIDKTVYAGWDAYYEVYLALNGYDDVYDEPYVWLDFYAWMMTRNIPRNTVLQLKITYTDYFGYPQLVDAPAKKGAKTRGADTSGSTVKWSIEETMY